MLPKNAGAYSRPKEDTLNISLTVAILVHEFVRAADLGDYGKTWISVESSERISERFQVGH
jgi:hypothetical protein